MSIKRVLAGVVLSAIAVACGASPEGTESSESAVTVSGPKPIINPANLCYSSNQVNFYYYPGLGTLDPSLAFYSTSLVQYIPEGSTFSPGTYYGFAAIVPPSELRGAVGTEPGVVVEWVNSNWLSYFNVVNGACYPGNASPTPTANPPACGAHTSAFECTICQLKGSPGAGGGDCGGYVGRCPPYFPTTQCLTEGMYSEFASEKSCNTFDNTSTCN